MTAPIRILIIDPHELMRVGIRLACKSRDSLEVVGEAEDIESGRQLASEASPDVVILDLPNCDEEDLQSIRQLHAEFPTLGIIVFTSVDSADIASNVIAAGASAYLIKIAGLDEIAVAIRCVHVGRTFISHSRRPRVLSKPDRTQLAQIKTTISQFAASESIPSRGLSSADDHSSVPAGHAEASAPNQAEGEADGEKKIAITHQAAAIGPAKHATGLSRREIEVLSLLSDGLTNKQVAEKLFLSVKTVETYRARIMKKHDLRDRSELVRFARESAELMVSQAG